MTSRRAVPRSVSLPAVPRIVQRAAALDVPGASSATSAPATRSVAPAKVATPALTGPTLSARRGGPEEAAGSTTEVPPERLVEPSGVPAGQDPEDGREEQEGRRSGEHADD